MKKIKYLAGILTALVCSMLCQTYASAAEKQTIYNSPYVTFSPDKKAWTTNAGEKEGEHYTLGKKVTTGTGSSLTALQTGQHYYRTERSGEIPIGFWRVEHSLAQCIHDRYPAGTDYHGVVFGRRSCGESYYSGWRAYCADCGERVSDMYIYMSYQAAGSIDYLTQMCGNGEPYSYYYICPHCNNLEQGSEMKLHRCKAVSWNRYQVRYNANAEGKQSGYMENSIHMYNNETEYEGEAVTPLETLTMNTYQYTGYEFLNWNTKPDGSGTSYQDGQQILNLTAENWEEGSAGKGVVTLYAQWRPAKSTLVIDANGGTYSGRAKVAVTQEYGTSYAINNSLVKAPAGYTVNFRTNGGSAVNVMSNRQCLTEWKEIQPFEGRVENGRYFFVGTDGHTDTLIAEYALTEIILPETKKEGSSFGGWYYDEEFKKPAGGAGDLFLPNKNLILYAQWVDLVLSSEDNYVANVGKGAVDLKWEQPDGKEKLYRIFQSRDGKSWTKINSTADGGTDETISETFGYSGKEKTYTVPATGIYTLTTDGAQGGNYDTFTGGYGGRASMKVWLKKGEVLTYTVGGQNGYHGGGTASAYGNGGGSTIVSSDEKGVLLIAGGGGGASCSGNGGFGGSGASVVSGSSGQNGMAGGGGGYKGGTAGEEVKHAHNTSCYHSEEGTNCGNAGFYGAGTASWQNTYGEANYGRSNTESSFMQMGHTYTEPTSIMEATIGDKNNYIGTPYGGTLKFSINAYAWGESIQDEYQPVYEVYGIDGKLLATYDCSAFSQNYVHTESTTYPIHCQSCNGKQKTITQVFSTDFNGSYVKKIGGSEICDNGSSHGWPYSTRYQGTITMKVPEEVEGIYFRVSSRIVCGRGDGAEYSVELKDVQYSYAGKQLICGKKEGEVISSKPAYGGSNYVNTAFAVSQTSLPGKRSGDGLFSIQSREMDFIESFSLSGVEAPDLESPGRILNVKKEILKVGTSNLSCLVSWEEPVDYGTEYLHYAASYTTSLDGMLCCSNKVSNILLTGVKGYYFLLDKNAYTTVTAANGKLQEEKRTTVSVAKEKQYLHIAAVDAAGNVGATEHVEIDGLENTDVSLRTRKLLLEGEDNVYPAMNRDTYYVRSDGVTPFQLELLGYMNGIASKDFQLNYSAYESLSGNGTARNVLKTPSEDRLYGEFKTEAEDLLYYTEGTPLLMRYPYSYTIRRSQNRELVAVQKFTLNPSASGRRIEVIPRTGADKQGKIVWSVQDADRQNSIYLIGDGMAPVITGMELLRGKDVINRPEGTVHLTVSARDDLSGVRDFYVKIVNQDNFMEEVFKPDRTGKINIDITGDRPLFSGDFTVVAYACDNVGNMREETADITEFALTTKIERVLEPHAPTFKCGESGILTITTTGYAQMVEVIFPAELTALNPTLNQRYVYAGTEEYKKEEQLQFMIPLYAPVNQQFIVTVRAFKGNKRLERFPSLSTIEVGGSILEDFRTRLR